MYHRQTVRRVCTSSATSANKLFRNSGNAVKCLVCVHVPHFKRATTFVLFPNFSILHKRTTFRKSIKFRSRYCNIFNNAYGSKNDDMKNKKKFSYCIQEIWQEYQCSWEFQGRRHAYHIDLVIGKEEFPFFFFLQFEYLFYFFIIYDSSIRFTLTHYWVILLLLPSMTIITREFSYA